jgi:glutathione peroxidase-family protein
VNAIDGSGPIDMSQFRGHPVLIVNVATKCGLTENNYAQLKEFDEKYYERGLRIVLFPCNQFAGQESGDNSTVCHFIQGISPRFIVSEKVNVNGSNEHPIYSWLKSKCRGFLVDAIKWNFTKVQYGFLHPVP